MKDNNSFEAYDNMFKEFGDVVTTDELCQMLGICKIKAYELIHTGVLKTVPCGRHFKIPKIFVINFVLNGASQETVKEDIPA